MQKQITGDLCALACVFSIGYLLGNLSNDFVFDLEVSESKKRTYYCALVDSFSSVLGFSRLFVPSVILGLCSVYKSLFCVGIQRIFAHVSVLTLVTLGAPLLVLNLYHVSRACASLQEPWPETLLVVSHLGMLFVFSVSLFCEVAAFLNLPVSLSSKTE